MRKMHLKRRVKERDYKLLADTLTIGAPISKHTASKHTGSKRRKKKKKRGKR